MKTSEEEKLLLVGDNPFHGISHLSQERARVRAKGRGEASPYPEHCADLVITSLENGANGFMFSVSDTTLSILKVIREKGEIERLSLYAIVPYAYEYVRLANQLGGIPGVAKKLGKEIALSGNLSAVAMGLKGVLGANPKSLLKTYLSYEVSRIKSSAGKHANLGSLMLHEVATDLALAYNLNWFFQSYVDFVSKLGATPGFNTGNFAYLVEKFNEWSIDMREVAIAAPFNKVGFQMNPLREDCEKTLAELPKPNVIAISILAAGYLSPSEAIDYLATLPNIKGVAVGVSKVSHARETFRLLKEKLG